jgi:hypothetical protein
MSQTDPRAVAAQLWCLPQHAHKEMDVEFAESIAHALADAERRGLERAAKMMCSYCNDPQWPRSAIVQGNAVHIGPITGSLFPCNAMQIHSALRAQAQADKEE